MSDFVKFPRTPHLFVLEGLDIRDDKVLPPIEASIFYTFPTIVEEKVDGANIGISLNDHGELNVQSRGSYITTDGHLQFRTLWPWVYERMHLFQEHLGARFILFGEWCFAKHSILYDRLPDWFLAFDIYDRDEKSFLAIEKRNRLLAMLNVIPIKQISSGIHTRNEFERMLKFTTSEYADLPIEGIYVRLEKNSSLYARAKVVREDFIQSIDTHWSKGGIETNRRIHSYSKS